MNENAEHEILSLEMLKSSLNHIESEGFGDDVDSDSIIEEAARRYLALFDETR